MELTTAFRRYLARETRATGYAQDRIYRHHLLHHVQGTGRVAIVVSQGTDWTTPDPVQSAEFPTLILDYWADPDRDDDGLVIRPNAIDKALAVHRVLDPTLHNMRDTWVGGKPGDPGLRVIRMSRQSEPMILTRELGSSPHDTVDGHDLQDTARVSVFYSAQVAH